MRFLPELRKFLVDGGTIYTVRGYDMREADVFVEDVQMCHRKPLGRVEEPKDLLPYVHLSGFATVEAWWEKIEFFTKPGQQLFLYEISVLGFKEV